MSRLQWLEAALLYGGAGSVLSHETAAGWWGLLPGEEPDRVSVTVPHGRHPVSTARIAVHQSERPLRPRILDGWPVTPPARTAIDVCLGLDRLDAVRDVLGRALQSGRASAAALGHELELAPSRGSLLPRRALEEVQHNAHAASEARFLRLVTDGGLPLPELNAPVTTWRGIRFVDALWRALGRGVEVDGRTYHLSPAAWAADLQRQNDIQSAGIVLLRIAAERLWTEPDRVLAEVRAFLGELAA
jgi:hypothetical protein